MTKLVKKAFSFLKSIALINPWKTLYFNLYYFSLKTAIRLPVLIFWRTEFFSLRGKIIITSPISTGMIRIGAHGLGTQDLLYSRTMLDLNGTLIIKGKTNIGRGCKISIGRNAILEIGKNLTITGDTSIICHKEISFGDNCLLSWHILIMDTDFHKILNENEEIINENKPIRIGNHIWIGCRNTILKGVSLPDNSIISANSTITKSFMENNCIIGGHGKDAHIIKRGVNWSH